MRLKSIELEGFRGFVKKTEIDLSADVILLQGPNGAGKTSLLDAILWALTGRLDRFGDKGTPVSLYAREGIARVALTLSDGERDCGVTRVTDGERDGVKFRVDDAEYDGSIAQAKLSECLLPHLHERAESGVTLSNVLTRGVYLQQDLVRQFVDSDSDAERFSLIGQIIGAGMILELQATLEKARNQWSRNITAQRKEQLDPLVDQAGRIDGHLQQLSTDPLSGAGEARADSTKLFDGAIGLFGKDSISLSEAPTTSSGLDRLIKEIVANRLKIERELSVTKGLIQESDQFQQIERADGAELQLLQQRMGELKALLSGADAQVDQEVAALARIREQRLRNQNKMTRLANMAGLALMDLGDQCPVCQQAHDLQKTRNHLHDLISAAAESIPDASNDESALQELRRQRDQLQQDLTATRRSIDEIARTHHEFEERRLAWSSRLAEVGVSKSIDVLAALSARAERISETLARTTALLQAGEELSVRIVRLGEQRRRAELQDQRKALTPRITAIQNEIEKLEKTHTVAGRIIDGLRRASLDVTSGQIEKVGPLFQRIYSRIDPHPTFRVTQLVTEMERGKGLLRAGIRDPDIGIDTYDALPILSSSQLNSFAVSLFLALNLGLPSIRLNLTVLDDPLQSLDSINLLGLVDVLRRVRQHRQIIVSTHEPRLLGLLQRKLRPVHVGQQMTTVFFDGWSRHGPEVRVVPISFETAEAKVLAA